MSNRGLLGDHGVRTCVSNRKATDLLSSAAFSHVHRPPLPAQRMSATGGVLVPSTGTGSAPMACAPVAGRINHASFFLLRSYPRLGAGCFWRRSLKT